VSDTPSNVEFEVLAFVAAINAHDPSAIVARCSPRHVFVDSLGNRLTGEGQLQQAWEWYFATFPDYRIEVEALAVTSDCVLLSGSASGTHSRSGAKWSIPAAWKAKVVGVRIAYWQVYADNKPVYEILNRGG
jgi:ketosteroid isomerase-like protein